MAVTNNQILPASHSIFLLFTLDSQPMFIYIILVFKSMGFWERLWMDKIGLLLAVSC